MAGTEIDLPDLHGLGRCNLPLLEGGTGSLGVMKRLVNSSSSSPSLMALMWQNCSKRDLRSQPPGSRGSKPRCLLVDSRVNRWAPMLML